MQKSEPRLAGVGAPILELKSVAKHFGGLKVIERVDLAVAEGEILGILGPNGAGKSTMFNLIAGVMQPSAGAITFDGKDITRMPTWDRCAAGIGRTYQVPKPFREMSAFENVLVAAVHGGRLSLRAAIPHARDVLALTGLARLANLPAGRLSLLDLKRLELAKALGQRPRLLLLDEIAGGLTDAECDSLLTMIAGVHRQGVTIVWIEHVIHALRRLATRLAVLYAGSILTDGAPAEVLADSRVREVYLGA